MTFGRRAETLGSLNPVATFETEHGAAVVTTHVVGVVRGLLVYGTAIRAGPAVGVDQGCASRPAFWPAPPQDSSFTAPSPLAPAPSEWLR